MNMVTVKLGLIGENAVVTATDTSGDSPSAFTIAELRDVVMTLTQDDGSTDAGMSFKLLVIDRTLEALETQYIECNAKPS